MKITVPAELLPEIWRGVVEVGDARHDLDAWVLVNRMYEAVAEWFGPWDERATELIVRHTGGPLSIGPGDEGHAAFIADPEVQEHWGREIELDVEPIQWSMLKKAEGLRVSRSLAALRHVGLVVDEKPAPEKSTPKKRRKS